jgi:hypothetical protein
MSEFTQVITAAVGDHPLLTVIACIGSLVASCTPLVNALIKLHVSKDTKRSKNLAAMTAAEKRRK